MVHFLQFFALIYVWAASNPGVGMKAFFTNPSNSNIVEQGLNRLLEAMKKYDDHHSLRLSKSESGQLVRDLLPSHAGVFETAYTEIFQEVMLTAVCPTPFPFVNTSEHGTTEKLFSRNKQSRDLSFRNLLFLIYAILSRSPG